MREEKRKRLRKCQLDQYIALGKEIALLEREMGKAPKVADTVRGSSRTPPYLEHTVLIVGMDAETKRKLDWRRRKASRQRNRIMEYIADIDDSQVRQIMSLRYLHGMSWAKVAACVGGGNTNDSVRKAAIRYMKRD